MIRLRPVRYAPGKAHRSGLVPPASQGSRGDMKNDPTGKAGVFSRLSGLQQAETQKQKSPHGDFRKGFSVSGAS
ncbi:hypothetical protein [uncultured Desulfovibrio sp.]|uniref:hypothetical protein n=1 Tax=uncultured Desulfovibrio sp. TaxID=167968 RepID=UPI00263271C5|nr:hypothetical protein [uncultured Desulfovibrio sp.]